MVSVDLKIEIIEDYCLYDVMACSVIIFGKDFRGTCYFHFQGRRALPLKSRTLQSLPEDQHSKNMKFMTY
jgi:hypothetical protein